MSRNLRVGFRGICGESYICASIWLVLLPNLYSFSPNNCSFATIFTQRIKIASVLNYNFNTKKLFFYIITNN